jgi:isoleucyl-tRNA synthetase
MDVWFDSGGNHATSRYTRRHSWPADLYLRGPTSTGDGSSRPCSLRSHGGGDAPYREVCTTAGLWTGREENSNRCNGIEPEEIKAVRRV